MWRAPTEHRRKRQYSEHIEVQFSSLRIKGTVHAEQSAAEAEEEVWRVHLRNVPVHNLGWNVLCCKSLSHHLVNKNGIDTVPFSSLFMLERLRELCRQLARLAPLQRLRRRLRYAHRGHGGPRPVIKEVFEEGEVATLLHFLQVLGVLVTCCSLPTQPLLHTTTSASDGKLLKRRRRSTHMKKKG